MEPMSKSDLLMVACSIIAASLLINFIAQREVNTALPLSARASDASTLIDDSSVELTEPVPAYDVEVEFGKYFIQIATGSKGDECCFYRTKDRTLVLKQSMPEGGSLTLLCGHNGPAVHFEAKHEPVVILEHETGAGFEYLVFELGSDSVKLAHRIGITPMRLHLEEINKRAVFVGDDCEQLPFFGQRPVGPKLNFVWVINKQGELVLDPGLSRRPIEKSSAFIVHSAAWSADKKEIELQDLPLELIDQIVELAYDGHLSAARRTFEANWPRNLSGKTACWNTLMEQLKQSRYWSAVMSVNGFGPAPAFESVCRPRSTQETL